MEFISFKIIYSHPPPIGDSDELIIAKELYKLATNGEIMIEKGKLENELKGRMNKEQYDQAVVEAEGKEIIIVTKRKFGTKPIQELISLKIKVTSLDSVMWILKSLEKDCMTPIERAVQSRFKESFGIKMSQQEWNKLLEVITNTKLITKDPKETELEFDVTEIDDIVSGCKTFTIYPKGYNWMSFDMSLKFSDIDQELFKEFLLFLESHFLPDNDQSHIEDHCISGGRYGCAQFIKVCGTPNLRSCTLGQLSQFIQFAISEDKLRYQRTLLIWNMTPMKSKFHEISASDSRIVRKEKERINHKIKLVKQAVIKILTENPAGLSLAQLPLYLRYKLPFPLDLNELGFLKLKELLATMTDQVKVEIRGHNYPFAKLIHKQSAELQVRSGVSKEFHGIENDVTKLKKKYSVEITAPKKESEQQVFFDFNKYLEIIRNSIYDLLQEYPLGIDNTKLPLLIYMRTGIELNWYFTGCTTLLEFLQKYVMSYCDLEFIPINPYDPNRFLIRQKCAAPLANYYNMPTYGQQYYPIHYRFDTDPKNFTNNAFGPIVDMNQYLYDQSNSKSASGSIPDQSFTIPCKVYV